MKHFSFLFFLGLFFFSPFFVVGAQLDDNACVLAGEGKGRCTSGGAYCALSYEKTLGECTDAPGGGIGPKKRYCCAPIEYQCLSAGGECKVSDSACSVVAGKTCVESGKTCCLDNADTSKLTDSQCSKKAEGSRCESSCAVFSTSYYSIGDCTGSRQCCKPEGSPLAPAPKTTANFDYTPIETIPGQGNPADLASYIKAIYLFALFSVGIAALIMVMVGAFVYITAAGNSSQTEKGKEIIKDALLGILVAFGAWLILFVINPDLVKIDLRSLSSLGSGGGSGSTGPTDSHRAPIGTCQDIDSALAADLNAANHGVPQTLLAAFMKRECPKAMTNPGACPASQDHTCRAGKGCVGGPMQFQDATFNGAPLNCTGDKHNRSDALKCAAKMIQWKSGGDYSDAGIRKAAEAYCGKCLDPNCGGSGNNYCDGIVNNYHAYKDCPTP